MDNNQKFYLTETAHWQKFIGILMMVSTVFLVLLGVFFIVIGFVSDGEFLEEGTLGILTGVSLGVVYLLCAVLYYFFGIYLLRAAKALKALKAWGSSDDEADLTEGLKNTKSFFKLFGILSIIGLCIIALAIVVGVVVAIVALV